MSANVIDHMQKLLAEVGDSSTSSERLRQIARTNAYGANSPRAEVLATLTKNPNTPLDVLIQLAKEFPAQFLANPVLPLLSLESPSFFGEIPDDFLLRLCNRADAPPAFLAAVVAYPRARQAASMAQVNIALVGEAPPGSGLAEARAMLAGLKPGNPHLLRDLYELGMAPGWATETVASVVTCLPEERVGGGKAGRRRKKKVHKPLALYGAPALQKWQERHGPFTEWPDSEGLRRGTAQDPRTPPELLQELAVRGSYEVRLHIVRNPAVTVDMLRFLARPENSAGRQLLPTLAAHPATPIDVLQSLVSSPSEAVRIAVAANPSCPLDRLYVLMADPLSSVRRTARQALEAHPIPSSERILHRKNACDRALDQGSSEPWGTVTRFLSEIYLAWHSQKIKNYQDHNLYWEYRLFLALSPDITTSELEKLARDAARPVRAIARDRLKDQNLNASFVRYG